MFQGKMQGDAEKWIMRNRESLECSIAQCMVRCTVPVLISESSNVSGRIQGDSNGFHRDIEDISPDLGPCDLRVNGDLSGQVLIGLSWLHSAGVRDSTAIAQILGKWLTGQCRHFAKFWPRAPDTGPPLEAMYELYSITSTRLFCAEMNIKSGIRQNGLWDRTAIKGDFCGGCFGLLWLPWII